MQVFLRPGCRHVGPRKEAARQEAESPGNWGPLLVGRGGGWPWVLLASMNFSNWKVKQVPPGDKELALEIRENTLEPQVDGVRGPE